MKPEYGKPSLPEAFRPERDFRYTLLRDENTRLFLRLFSGLVLASGVLYISAAVFAGESLFRSAGALVALFCSAGALALYRQGRIGGGAQMLVWGIWLSLLLQIFISNGLMSRSLMALPVIIMLAGWLLPPRGTLVLCLASLLAGAILAAGEQRGLLPLRTSPSPPLLVWLAYSIYVGLAAALAHFIFRGFRRRHDAMHRLSDDLAARIETLSATEAELRLVMESVPVMLFHGDRDQRCLYANRSYADFYAVDQEKLQGLSVREIVGAEIYDAFDVGATLDRALAGERFTYRAVRRTSSGEARVVDISMVPEPDGQDGTRGFFSLFRDVTEEVRAEDALRRSEEKFASVFRSSPLAAAITRLADGCYLDVNDAFVRLWGWHREEAIGRTSLELGKWATPETRAAWAAQLRQDGRVSNLETDFRTRTGELRRILLSAERIDMAGEACALVMTVDITERRRAEEKFTKVFHASPMAISISRISDGHYLDVNDAFVEQFGWSHDEFIGHTAVEIGIWISLTEREKWVAELKKAGRVKNWETALNSKAGVRHNVSISAERIWLEGEECVIGMVYDITERLRAENALRESEARLREAQRIGCTGSWDLDIASRRMTWSDELHRIYEREPGSFGCTWENLLSLVHPDDLRLMQNAWRTSPDAEGSHELRHRILTPDGRVKHLHVRFEIFHGSDGKPVRALGSAQDITGQVLAREEIQRLNAGLEQRVQERTAELTAANKELESFAYSISHDLRAPLRGIDGFSHLLAEEYAERLDETGRGYLERVRRAAQRMGTLIDDILELSRVTRLGMRRTSVDLSALAREILDEHIRAAPEHAVKIVLDPDGAAYGDPQLLRVMMQNLLENAWKYSAKESSPRIEFGCGMENGERVFHVRDNGVGFDMQYADRLFAPFQRLHKPEEFEGTGIGLATVARVVHRHGGRVWAESAPGRGAIFRFTLGQPPVEGQ